MRGREPSLPFLPFNPQQLTHLSTHLSTCPSHSVGFDLKSLFIGSEGTLGMISKVCMKVHTKPTTCDVAVLSCPDFANVMKLKERLEVGLSGLVSAVEIMDRRVLELVKERTSTSVPWEVRG